MEAPTLTNLGQNDINSGMLETRRKRGRPRKDMPYGNVSGKKQKGVYLSRVTCDMLAQLSIVTGKTESAIQEDAVREYFMRIKSEYEKANISWKQILESCNYVLPKWQR